MQDFQKLKNMSPPCRLIVRQSAKSCATRNWNL